MSDLRAGLVEQMAEAMHGEVHPLIPGTISCSRCVVGARLALDACLDYLTTNADQWAEADRLTHTRPGYDPPRANHHTTADTALHLVAVLRDWTTP